MLIHHLGYACSNIEEALMHVRLFYEVTQVSEIIYDEIQDAYVCLIDVNNGPRIELVSGKPVVALLEKGIRHYHTCYEVDDILFSIKKYQSKGAILFSEPKPAKLFNGRMIAFLETDLGLIELFITKDEIKPEPFYPMCIIEATPLVESLTNDDAVSDNKHHKEINDHNIESAYSRPRV